MPFLPIILLWLVTTTVMAQPGNPGKGPSGWNNHPGKGRVRQSFSDAVESGNPSKGRTPIEGRQYSVSSPDKALQLKYIYDYSQPTLVVNGEVSGGQTARKSFAFPVDDGFTSHGLFINNGGEIFAIHTDVDDGLYLIRYRPETEESQVLEVGPGGGRRNRFIPYFGTGGKVYVANVTENRAGELTGVMVSTFDFAADRVEEVQFHPVSAQLKQQMSPRLPQGRYDLTKFEIAPNGERVLELEKHGIDANAYRYDPFAEHHPANWQHRKQQVQIGEKIIFRLNAEGEAVLEEIIDNFKTD
jgi:hypothetical protein